MRVLFLTNSPYLGGTARILQSWITLGREGNLQSCMVVQQPSDLIPWANAERVNAMLDPMPWPDRRRPLRSLRHAFRVARWARRIGTDIIHCNEHNVYPFALVLRRFLPRPVVCHVRYLLDREFAEWAFAGKRAPAALLWTSHQQKADSAAAVANVVAEEKQHVVRLGTDLSRFGTMLDARHSFREQWGIATDEVLIATASPIRPRKKVDHFVSLIGDLATRHKKVVGVIAGGPVPGDEAYRAEIERQIEATGLGRRLRWIGYLEPVEPLYQAADIVISTSEYETFGNSVCEAMACCKPVVGYRGGSVAEVVGDCGMIVETGDLDGLSAATDKLVLDPALRQSLGEAAHRRVKAEFNPADSFFQLLSIYNSVLAKHS